MTGMITECNGLTVRGAESALCAEDEKLFAAEFARIPSHAHILGPTKNVAAGRISEHLRSERKFSCWTRAFRLDVVNIGGILSAHRQIEP